MRGKESSYFAWGSKSQQLNYTNLVIGRGGSLAVLQMDGNFYKYSMFPTFHHSNQL
jgi:hypothetical protein